MPDSVQEYFKYNPAKAEELLDEAGLTRGSDGTRFEIELMIGNASQLAIEAAEISVGFWDDIGVNVTLDIVDEPLVQSRLFAKQYDFMESGLVGRPNALNDFRAGHQWNRSNLNDPEFLAMWEEVLISTDSEVQIQKIKDSSKKFLELVPVIQVPAGFGGDYWQPWVQNHNGEKALAFVDYSTHWAYTWFDRDLRAEETGFKD